LLLIPKTSLAHCGIQILLSNCSYDSARIKSTLEFSRCPNVRVEYEFSVENCDVSIDKRKALKEYRRIRQECLGHIRGPSVLSVFAQLQHLAWNTALFQTLNEGRRLEPDAPVNGPLWGLVTEGYAISTSLGIRRLLDNDKRRISLAWVISRIEKNIHLMTREFYVCHDGLPCDYQDAKDCFYANLSSSLKQTQPFSVATGKEGWFLSEQMHENFDGLCGEPVKRNRSDQIDIGLVNSFKDALKSNSITSISTLASRVMAHSVICNQDDIEMPSYADLIDALSTLMSLANEISSSIFYDTNIGSVVPLYRGDPVESLDQPWISTDNLGSLRSFWEDICKGMDEWV